MLSDSVRDAMKNTDMATLISRAPVYIEEENVIWMVTIYSGFLIKLDLNIKSFSEYYKIPYDDYDNRGSCVSMCKYGDKLILAPNNAEKIVTFNLNTHEFDCIEMPLDNDEKKIDSKIGRICISDSYAYLIGYKLHAIFCLDIEQKKCERVYKSNGNGLFSYLCGERVGDKLYVPMYEKNTLLIMNLEINQIEEKEIATPGKNGFTSMVADEMSMHLITKDGTCILYGASKGTGTNIKICNEVILCSVADENKGMWCFGQYDAFIWHIMKDDTVEKAIFEYSYIEKMANDNTVKYDLVVKTKSGIVFQARTDGTIYNLDIETGKISKIDIGVDLDLYRQIYEKRVKNGSVLEDSKYAFEYFLEVVMDLDKS